VSDDPNLVDANDPRLYQPIYKPLPPGARRRDYSKRTPEEVAQDLTAAHENLRQMELRDNARADTVAKLLREKDQLQKKDLDQQEEINGLKKTLKKTNIWTTVAVSPGWAVVGRIIWLVLTRHK